VSAEQGQRLSHYTLVEKIGAGGMGVVWKAEDSVLQRTVAIKVLPADLALNDERRRMFLEEARLAASVSDAHIVQVHELGREGDLDFIVMEYVEGQPLSDILTGKPLDPERVTNWAMQVARGLSRAHRKRLLHRDLKPGNLLVTPDGELKIADFGLAMLFERSDSTMTSLDDTAADPAAAHTRRVLVGTLGYMSPEQVRDETLDARSDIFSFGIVLYEMATGERPFRGTTISEILNAIVAARPTPPHDIVPHLPLELDRIIQKSLAGRREERYQSMDDLSVDLQRLQRELQAGQALRYSDAVQSTPELGRARATPTVPISGLAALLYTRIHETPELKRRLGSASFERVIVRHDQLFADIVRRVPGAAILKDTGEGFLCCFPTATEAVMAALQFQQGIANEAWDPEPPRVGMGLHIGELASVESDVTGQAKILGLAGDIVAQLAQLALPNQLLVTRGAFDEARQSVRELPSIGDGAASDDAPSWPLRWMAHGRYVLEGSEEPLEVFEVGVQGSAPLAPPPDSPSAQRSVSADEEPTFGWRPAAGLDIPWRKGWQLDHRLGEGGFGEVWLATFPKTGELRVFKFCFDAHRLRAFKRELTLFRLLREALGNREDICKLYEVQLEEPPFYLESEYTERGDLKQWAATKGGVKSLPLETRLDLVARIGEAVAAAHSVGILHKDIKPDNVLIYEADGTPRPRLADFGIGAVADRAELEKRNITAVGLTEVAATSPRSSSSGTPMYMPPESLAGKPFTVLGDVYALGVLLYQMVAGDLQLPLGPGWEREIEDDLLREDIAACVDQEPERRLSSAPELAQRLRTLEERRRARRQLVRRRRTVRAGVALSALAVVLVPALLLHTGRVARERDRANLEAQTARQVSQFLVSLFQVADPAGGRGNDVTAREILDRGAERIGRELDGQPVVRARMMNTMGRAYHNLGLYPRAESLLTAALKARRSRWGSEHPEVAESLTHLGSLYLWTGKLHEAQQLQEEGLRIRVRLLGDEHIDTAWSRYYLGSVLVFGNDVDSLFQGYRLLERALPVFKADPTTQLAVSWCLNDMGAFHQLFEQHPEGLDLLERSLAIKQRILSADHLDVAIALGNIADTFLKLGRLSDARGHIDEMQRILQKNGLGKDHILYGHVTYMTGELHRRQRNYDQARAMLQRSVEIYSKVDLKHWAFVDLWHALARLSWNTGDHTAADSLFRQTASILERSPNSPRGAQVYEDFATFLVEVGREPDAEGHRARATEIRDLRKAARGVK
jgi:serine/threonine-protein kinase